MATVTPNFNWPVPTSTDLVKDGATAIEALGDSIDASLVDLKGGTTGQVLSKTSNTDMDFTWVTSDDANAIQNTIVDAKGDLIAATAADTPARLAVGTNGQVLTADSTASTGLAWSTVSVPTSLGYAAGKNKIINGDFGVWQRGTSFSANAYNADRWICGSDATVTISRQTFTPGTAPVSGYEGTYFLRLAKSAGGSYLTQRTLIEDVRVFAGQTVVLSFWAKASTAVNLEPYYEQIFGTGGSATVGGSIGSSTAITTSWARYSFSVTLPSVSGKTIGTSSYLNIFAGRYIGAAAVDIDLWGVQLEVGSTATTFQTATGTIQGELASCQRYFQKTNNQSEAPGAAPSSTPINCLNASTTLVVGVPPFKVSMRVAPTVTLYSPVTGTTGKIRSGGADITASVGDAGEYTIGYISATGLTAGSNSSIAFTADAEL